MPDLNHFRTFEIAQDGGGNAFELSRTDERVVCLAFDARFGCFCEIAALMQTSEGEATTMEDFLEQAGMVAGLHHRGLANLLDYGDDQGVRFYAVEFVDGETLSDYAARVNGLPAALALELCADLAEALCAISVLGMPIAAGRARVTLDDRGRLRVRIVDYPLGMRSPEGPRDMAAAVYELAHLLDQLGSGEVIGGKGHGAADVSAVAEQLRALGSVHDAAPLLRKAAGDHGFVAVESRHRPRLLLAQKLLAFGSPEEFLSDDYRVEQVSPLAADPYSVPVTRASENRALRMHVLPPEYILSDTNLPIYETEKSAAVVGAEALWRSEHFRLVSEPRLPGFSLTTLLRQAGELSDLEVMLLLDKVETAILEARSAGAELAKLHPDNVLIHFENWEHEKAEAQIKQRPLTAWPEFAIVLRAHHTMRGLTTLTPNAKQRFMEMRAALEHGEPVANLAVLELYLHLHDSGRAEQAEELLDRFEQSCRAGVAAAAVAEPEEEEEYEEEVEVMSPIALQTVEGLDAYDDGADDDDEGFSPLGGGILFGRDQFDEDEAGAQAGDIRMISPIAAAMGVEVDEQFALPYEESDEDDDEPAVGLGQGLLNLDEVEENYDDDDAAGSPFGLSPVEDEDEALPELDLGADSRGDGVGRGVVLFVVLAIAAIGLAAVIAHLTGRAFWLK